jgi:hypothetical protein
MLPTSWSPEMLLFWLHAIFRYFFRITRSFQRYMSSSWNAISGLIIHNRPFLLLLLFHQIFPLSKGGFHVNCIYINVLLVYMISWNRASGYRSMIWILSFDIFYVLDRRLNTCLTSGLIKGGIVWNLIFSNS